MNISDRARELVWHAERDLAPVFSRTDAIEMVTQTRVLEAFWEARVSTRHTAQPKAGSSNRALPGAVTAAGHGPASAVKRAAS